MQPVSQSNLLSSSESLLRKIIRESVQQNLDLSRMIEEFLEAAELGRLGFRSLQGHVASGNPEIVMNALLSHIEDARFRADAYEDEELAKIAEEMSSAIKSFDKDQIFNAISQTKMFKTPPRLGASGGADTIAAAQQMAPIIGASISPRSIASARKTGKNDRLFTQVTRHPQFRSLAVKYGSSPSSSVATAIVNILVGQ